MKPCPFCGGVGVIVRPICYDNGEVAAPRAWAIECCECGAFVTAHLPTEERAIQFWNSRPEVPS